MGLSCIISDILKSHYGSRLDILVRNHSRSLKIAPTLLYGLEACPLKSADLKSLDYTVVGAFMKTFKSKSKEVASCCMEMFNCPLPSVSVNNRKYKFLQKFSASENIIICRHCADCAK